MAKNNAVQKKQTVSVPAVIAPTIDFAADAGAGMEGAGAESFVIPMLLILQSGSPQVKANSGRVIEGAKEGMLFESVGDFLHDGKAGIIIVPCAYRRTYLKWSADDAFQGEVLPEEVARGQAAGTIITDERKLYIADAAGKFDPKKSSKLTDARNHYVLIIDPETGDWRLALMSLRSTQIKKSRMLMTSLASVRVKTESGSVIPPTYANMVRATTVPESNDEGDWMGWNFRMEGFVKDPKVYAAAKKFHQSITAGLVKHEFTEAAAKDGAATPGDGF